MDTADDLTAAQKILLAAHRLEAAGHQPFTAEALAVAAWNDDPVTFGLRGFLTEYPDSNKVLAPLMGERGMVKRGWLIKEGTKCYTLSRQGREEAARILAGDDPAPKRRALARIQVPKELEAQLVGLFMTTAFRRYEEGMRREITYRDACRFWGLAEGATGDDVDRTLARTPVVLTGVLECLVGDAAELSNGQSVTRADLGRLCEVNQFLREAFRSNLERQRRQARRMVGVPA